MYFDILLTRRYLSASHVDAGELERLLGAVADPAVSAVVRRSGSSRWIPVRRVEDIPSVLEELATDLSS